MKIATLLSPLLFLVASSAETCPDTEIQCTSCRRRDAPVNVLETLPRLSWGGALLSSNLDAYDIVVCYGDDSPFAPRTANETCKILPSLAGGSLLPQLESRDLSASNPLAYVQGLVSYSIFGLCCSLLCVFVGLVMCQARICCCIRGGACGKRVPTFSSSPWRLGFVDRSTYQRLDRPAKANNKVASVVFLACSGAGTESRFVYPPRSRFVTRCALIVYVTLLGCFVLVGQLSGNVGLTSSMLVSRPTVLELFQSTTLRSVQAAANSPTALMNTVRGVSGPLSNLALHAASNVLAPALGGARDALLQSVDLHAVSDNVSCVMDGLNAVQTDPYILLSLLNEVSDVAGAA